MLRVLKSIFDIMAAVLTGILVIPLVPEIFGINTYCIQSGSMEPILETGSLIFTMKPKDIKIGDIITFQKWDIPVTHRVVDIQNGMYVTKGDANGKEDQGGILEKELLGKVLKLPGDRYCIPYMGYIHTLISQWKWGIMGILVSYILLRKSDRKKDMIC